MRSAESYAQRSISIGTVIGLAEKDVLGAIEIAAGPLGGFEVADTCMHNFLLQIAGPHPFRDRVWRDLGFSDGAAALRSLGPAGVASALFDACGGKPKGLPKLGLLLWSLKALIGLLPVRPRDEWEAEAEPD